MNTKDILTGIKEALTRQELSKHIDALELAVCRNECNYSREEWTQIYRGIDDKTRVINSRLNYQRSPNHEVVITFKGQVMPVLAKEFHKPRVAAYQIAIDAIEREWEKVDISFADHNELRFVMQKLKREQQKFITKHNVEL